MEADSDDIATDFSNDQIELTPKSDQVAKLDNKDDWDESKFEKKLNMQISKEQHNQTIEKVHENFEEIKQKHSIHQTIINDKNIVTVTRGEQKDQSEKTQENHENIKFSTEDLKPQKNQNLEERLDQLAIIQKTENTQTQEISQKPQTSLSQKQYSTQPQRIFCFSPTFKSHTITLDPTMIQAQQSKFYFQNSKLILTSPITSLNSSITFRLDNIKYCVGFGVGLKEILEKHDYDYKSTTETEMGHGLYIVTTQGYTWSHSQQDDDDAFRNGWNLLYSGVNVKVKLQGENLHFQWKKGQFSMVLPSRIRQKYTLCFCAYLHDKTDAISIIQE